MLSPRCHGMRRKNRRGRVPVQGLLPLPLAKCWELIFSERTYSACSCKTTVAGTEARQCPLFLGFGGCDLAADGCCHVIKIGVE